MRHHLRFSPIHPLLALVLALLVAANVQAAAPTNDTFETRTVIGSLPFTQTLDTREATTTTSDPACYQSNHTVWYQFTATANQRLQADTLGSDYDTTLCVYTGAPGALTMYALNDDADDSQSIGWFNVVAGETYYFLVGAYTISPGGTLRFNLDVPPPPPTTTPLPPTATPSPTRTPTLTVTPSRTPTPTPTKRGRH